MEQQYMGIITATIEEFEAIKNIMDQIEEVKYYDLNFVVTGAYVPITDFISSIENDQSLGFRIENFKLIPSDNNNSLQGSFTVRDVAIDIDSATQQTDNNSSKNKETKNNTNNTTNTNNEKSATNTTNNTTQQ